MSDTAISYRRSRIAASTVLTSGSEVEMATNTAPTKLVPRPVWTAMASPARDSTKPAARITSAAITILATAARSDMSSVVPPPLCCRCISGGLTGFQRSSPYDPTSQMLPT